MGSLNLPTVWFAILAYLWLGYFFLEGFDFGVMILLPFLGRDDTDRRVLINSIGPVWDGNEVWLVVAGAGTFAAFPEWYATLFSSFYLPLLIILVALIFRAVAFEFRGKLSTPAWRVWWDRALFFGSALPALLWGVAFAGMLHGVPIDAHKEFAGNFFDLLSPYALLGGLVSFALFTLHGALYLVLKTDADMRERARRVAGRVWWPALGLTFLFLAWSFVNAVQTDVRGVVPDWVPLGALGALVTVGWLRRLRIDFWAFLASGASVVLLFATIFLNLYPRVMVSSLDPNYSLTIYNASSSNYTLTVMTIVALTIAPFVLCYEAWSYWVFRKRIRREDFEPRPVAPEQAGSPGAQEPAGVKAP
ncbi:MAG: cytochrome d ubiquinol oxidase subunit II [Candidatus Dormibacteraeota bacterium]|nr:cytochrome d ubiquinol oxidase subunit II [Candidatus Dormibacteraeota bacterium]